MTGGQRRHLVEEEQLGPAGIAARRVAAHHVAPAARKSQTQMIQAFVVQRLFSSVCVAGIVDDAAIAGEQPALPARRGCRRTDRRGSAGA